MRELVWLVQSKCLELDTKFDNAQWDRQIDKDREKAQIEVDSIKLNRIQSNPI